MVYPKQVVWKQTSSAHPRPRRSNPQRERVEASLRLVGVRGERWDERTRTVQPVRVA